MLLSISCSIADDTRFSLTCSPYRQEAKMPTKKQLQQEIEELRTQLYQERQDHAKYVLVLEKMFATTACRAIEFDRDKQNDPIHGQRDYFYWQGATDALEALREKLLHTQQES